MRIYHQAGHNTKWNIESFEKNDVGDGIILSPVSYPKKSISNINSEIKRKSIFDPQFYIPDSQKKKLQSYDFFPETIMDGFSTNDFSVVAHEAAQLCVDFQIENDFEFVIVPCRFYPDLIGDYIKKQNAFTIIPFLDAIKESQTHKKIFFTLPLTITMITDDKFRTNLLNWATSFPELSGVYILVDFNERRKQIIDYEKFYSYILFVKELIEADLSVICGYCNTEGIILSMLDLFGITIGAYENTRSFSINKFLENEKKMSGPVPRLYFPKLLNWIRFPTAVEIRDDYPDLWEKIYTPTEYSEELLNRPQKPHFTQPQIYKHHFILINEQYEKIRNLKKDDRFEFIDKMIKTAHQLYTDIESDGIIFFDNNCTGEHLAMWNRVLKKLRTVV